MSTNVRPEISNKKAYHVPKHRMYELKHFCLQYPDWKKQVNSINAYAKANINSLGRGSAKTSPVEVAILKGVAYRQMIDLVENTCKEVAGDLYSYLLKGITEGIGYPALNPPCCKETYYDIYRRFFYLLDYRQNSLWVQ